MADTATYSGAMKHTYPVPNKRRASAKYAARRRAKRRARYVAKQRRTKP